MRGLHQMTLAFNFPHRCSTFCGGHKVIELPAHLIRVLILGTHWTRWWTTTWWRNLITGGKPRKGPFLKGSGLKNIPEREMSGLNLNIALAPLILGFVVGGLSLASIILLFWQLKNSWNKECVKTISSLSLLHEDQWVYLKHWAPKNYGNYGKFPTKISHFWHGSLLVRPTVPNLQDFVLKNSFPLV